MPKKTISIILVAIIYLIATGISYSFFSTKENTRSQPSPSMQSQNTGNDYQAIDFDQNKQKTESCPLNGALYSKEQKSWWEKHRPLGVMIENHQDARPQSGIANSDVTYEAVAEGGITRTLNIYYCQDAGIIGPVRSARTYFLDFTSEYGDHPLYAHVGGANTPGPANALGQISDYGWTNYNDLSQFSIGFPTFWRDQNRQGHDVATEHTMYSTTGKLWTFAQEKRKLTDTNENGEKWNTNFIKYKFKDGDPKADSQTIHIEFWNDPAYFVDWKFDKQSNKYVRNNGGKPHIDRNTNKQLTASNIVVLFMNEKHADDGYENNSHLLYGTKGEGKALIFQNGTEIKGTWKKASRTARTLIYDQSGQEIEFNRGKIWFEILPTDAVVKAE
jgi:hypothetical protein